MSSQSKWLSVLLVVALAWHAWSYGRANLSQMLWSCHFATLCLAIGLFLDSRTLVATGWLFHVGIGFPAWIIETVITRGTFGAAAIDPQLLSTSILVHFLPLAAGTIWFRSHGFQLPKRAVAFAWLLQVLPIPLTRPITPPELNVNLAHSVWPGAAGMFTRLWLFQTVISLLCLGSLLLVAKAMDWKWGMFQRHATSDPRRA